MNNKIFATVLLLFLVSFSFPKITGFDIGYTHRWESDRFILNAGISFPKFEHRGYVEAGISYTPHIYLHPDERASQDKLNDLVGMYSSYFYMLGRVIHPGITLGTTWKRDVGEEKYKFGPMYGFKLHVAILTFQISNEGIGGGINVGF